MTATIVKILMRVTGTLAGLAGIAILLFTFFSLHRFFPSAHAVIIVLVLLNVVLGLYGLYVTYLVWFRFSPLAVQHVCGILGIVLLSLVGQLSDPAIAKSSWKPVAFVGVLFVVFFGYRVVSSRLSRLLFPAEVGIAGAPVEGPAI